MSLFVDLGNDRSRRAWRPTTADRSLQKRIDRQYVSYTHTPCEKTQYFQLEEHNLDFKTMRQIRKDDATRYRVLRWRDEEEASPPAPPLAAEKKRPLPKDDSLFADFHFGMSDDDDERIVIDDKGDINELCDGSCKQSADCRKDHSCLGNHCFKVRGCARGTPHRAARSAFGQHQNGKRQKGCSAGNAAAHASQEPVRQANADKRAEEASFSGFNVKTIAPQEIAKAEAAYERALARFGHKYIDVYVFGASTGSKGYSLEKEACHTIFAANGDNKPILRSSQWSPKKPDMCVIPNDERFSINDSDHVFLLADGNWRGDSGKELAHSIEKALHIFGEQHAAKAGGRITPLWRAHGKGYPHGFGPYKVGLLVIERDAARRLPFGWKRSDGK